MPALTRSEKLAMLRSSRKNIVGWKPITKKDLKESTKKKRASQASTAVAKVGYSSGYRIYPKFFIAKQRYKIDYGLAAGSAESLNNAVFFSPSNIFDPDTSGVGGNPSLWTQLIAQYNHWTVLNCTMTVKVRQSNTANPMVFVITGCDDTTSLVTTLAKAYYDTDSKYVVTDINNLERTVKMKYSRGKIFTKAQHFALIGNATTSPSENYFFRLATQNRNFGEAPTQLNLEITMDFTTKWSEQKENPQL